MLPNLRLRLANRPENVLVVRQALTGVAECLGLDAVETNDLNTAVTEACNNVVAHAYEGAEGPLEVDLHTGPDVLAVLVRDHGIGMPAARRADHDGLGLAVIDALSRRAEFLQSADGGTEVRMEFAPGPKSASLEPIEASGEELSLPSHGSPREGIDLQVASSEMARAVLPRVLSVLAARAHFSTDRIADVQLVADVLAAKAGESITGSYLDVSACVQPRDLELRIGPLQRGRGESLLAAAADGLAPVIERLTDEQHRVALIGHAAETLELRLVDQRR